MDIKCLKCGTEYELDDTRIPPTGLTVKCTTCGFIFKATRTVEVPRKTMMLYGSTPPEPRVTWQIRKPDGTQFGFNDLTALRRLIQEGKVVESDEISRQGEGWRRILDIPEFAGFFIARAVSASPMVSPVMAPSLDREQVEGGKAAVKESPVAEAATKVEPQPPQGAEPPQKPEQFGAEAAPAAAEVPMTEQVTVVSQIPAQISREDNWLQNLNKFVEPAPLPAPTEEVPKEKVADGEPKGPTEGGPIKAVDKAESIEIGKKETSAGPKKMEAAKPIAEKVEEKPRPRQSKPPTHADLDDTDVYGRPKKGKKVLLKVLIMLILVAAAAVAIIKVFYPSLIDKALAWKEGHVTSDSPEMGIIFSGMVSADHKDLKLAIDKGEQLIGEGKLDSVGKGEVALCHVISGQILKDEAKDLQTRIEEATDKMSPGQQTKNLIAEMNSKNDEAINHLAKAVSLIQDVLKISPDNQTALLVQATYYIVQSDGDATILGKADPLMQNAGKDGANKEMAVGVRSLRMLKADPNSAEALDGLNKLLGVQPKNNYVRYVIARAMLAANKLSAAKETADAALAQNPDNSVMKHLLSEIQRRMSVAVKRPEPAPAAVQDAGQAPVPEQQKQEPQQAGVQVKGSQPEGQKPQEHKTPEVKTGTAETSPEKPEDKGEKGTVAQVPGSKPAAGGGFEGMLQAGRRLQKTGRAKQAVDYFLKAAELDPARAEPHTGLGWCYVELEKFDQAIAEFQKALTLKGPRCETLSGLGETYRYRKVKQEAIKYYQMYLQECPNGPDAPVARNNLNSLR